MKTKWHLTAAALGFFAASLPSLAQPNTQRLYGVTAISSELISVDPRTGTGSAIGTFGTNAFAYGIATRGQEFYIFDQSAGRLRQLDPATGQVGAGIDVGLANVKGEGDLAFRADGLGFLATALDANGNVINALYSFNLGKGTSSRLGSTTQALDGLAFVGNTLYGQGQDDGTLYIVNQSNATLTVVGSLGVSKNSPFGALAAAADGSLYTAINDRLFILDKSTGAATPVDPDVLDFGFSSVSGLAFAASNAPPGGGCRSDFVVTAKAGQSSVVVDFDDGTNDVTHCVPPSNSILPVGVTAVTCTSTNTSGNTNICTFNVTVVRPFLISMQLGTLRNDFEGSVGFRITVGTNDITVTHLGRIVALGNTMNHQVRILQASDRTELSGASVSVPTAGHPVREFIYVALGSPVTLRANQIYYIVSSETSRGDLWYDVDTQVTPSAVARVDSGVFAGGGYALTEAGSPNHAYGPVDFLFRAPGAAEPGPSVVIVSPSIGDFVAASSNLTIRTATSIGVTNVNFFAGTNFLGSNSVAPFSLTLSNLMPGVLRLSAQVTATNGLVSTSSVVIVNVTTNLTGSNTSFVVTQRLGRPRNDFNGFVGMQITVGDLPLQVTDLGRFFTVGNTGSHRLKIVRASDGTDVPGATVVISPNGGGTNAFRYALLAPAITLSAGATYYILSEEQQGGDIWYDLDTVVTTRQVATEEGAVFATRSSFATAYGPGRTYGPVDFNRYRPGVESAPGHVNGFGGHAVGLGSPEPVTITSLLLSGQIVLMINGQSRTTYSIQASDDQVNWIEIVRKNSNGKATIAVRVPSDLVRRHYRAVMVNGN